MAKAMRAPWRRSSAGMQRHRAQRRSAASRVVLYLPVSTAPQAIRLSIMSERPDERLRSVQSQNASRGQVTRRRRARNHRSAIADVLGQQGAPSGRPEIAEHKIRATGETFSNRTVSFSLAIVEKARPRQERGWQVDETPCGRPALGELAHDGKPMACGRRLTTRKVKSTTRPGRDLR